MTTVTFTVCLCTRANDFGKTTATNPITAIYNRSLNSRYRINLKFLTITQIPSITQICHCTPLTNANERRIKIKVFLAITFYRSSPSVGLQVSRLG